MVLYPAAAAFVLIWLLLSFRNVENGLVMTNAVGPFGMFAAGNLGGPSIILANLLAMLTIGVLILRYFSVQQHALAPQVPKAAIYLFLFAAYSLFSGFILVRLFQGQFLVFPMTVTSKGTMVSAFFSSTMVPLRPSNSNISQPFYILLSAMLFWASFVILRRRGPELAERGLVWAATINILLGLMDLFKLDAVLQFVRTADYNLNNEHMVAGVQRIIGGFSEAAGFGALSSALFAYFAVSFLMQNRSRDALLAVGSLICALLALSSTAILSLAMACFLILVHGPVLLKTNISRQFAHFLVIAIAILICAACLMLLMPQSNGLTARVLDTLIFSKGTSLSGLERAAWAQGGLDVFFETWGLGAGAGSVRSNGLFSVLLGNVGLPGTLAFAMFLFHTIARPLPACDVDLSRVFYAGRISALTFFASLLVSATGPDPTLILMVFTCLSIVAREIAFAQTPDFDFQRQLQP